MTASQRSLAWRKKNLEHYNAYTKLYLRAQRALARIGDVLKEELSYVIRPTNHKKGPKNG